MFIKFINVSITIQKPEKEKIGLLFKIKISLKIPSC